MFWKLFKKKKLKFAQSMNIVSCLIEVPTRCSIEYLLISIESFNWKLNWDWQFWQQSKFEMKILSFNIHCENMYVKEYEKPVSGCIHFIIDQSANSKYYILYINSWITYCIVISNRCNVLQPKQNLSKIHSSNSKTNQSAQAPTVFWKTVLDPTTLMWMSLEKYFRTKIAAI